MASQETEFRKRVDFIIDEAVLAARIACAAVQAEATLAGALGGSRQFVEYAKAVDAEGSKALDQLFLSFDIAIRRFGAKRASMVKLMRAGVGNYIAQLNDALNPPDPAWGVSDDLFETLALGVQERLLRRIDQHLIGLTAAQPGWAERHPILKDGLLILFGAALAAIFDLLVG